ncbi:MAG: MFS transporter [Propionibacteriaceae bacterium]|jgi:putative MFS transporter|nr:MFS transporter [Propionibacteriaceae bacterium]
MPNLNERLDAMPYKGWHAKMTASVGTGVLFDAYDTQIMTVCLMVLASVPGFEALGDEVLYGLLGGAAFGGMIIGALGGGQVADKLGRVKAFSVFIAIYAIAIGLAGTSPGFWWLLVWRFLSGIGLGAVVPIALSYLSEFLPAKVRGRSLGIVQALFGVGGAVAFFLGWAFIFSSPSGWRTGFYLGALPLILAVIAWFAFPESVRWLVQKGRFEEAAQAVDRLERKFLGAPTVSVEEAVALEKQIAAARVAAPKTSLTELFTPQVRKATIIMSFYYMVLSVGTYGFGIWLPKILQNQAVADAIASGADMNDKSVAVDIGRSIFLYMAIAALIAAVIGPVAGVIADKIGRRLSVLLTMVYFAAAVLFLAAFSTKVGGVMLFAMILVCIGLQFCNVLLWIFVPENFPTRVRASGVGFAGSCGRVVSFLSPMVIGAIIKALGDLSGFIVVAIVTAVGGVIVYLFSKETAGESLEKAAGEK